MNDFEKYIQRYLDLVSKRDWIEELKNSEIQTLEIYQSLSDEESKFRYAEGKWRLKTVLQHLIDTEKFLITEPLDFLARINF